MISNELTGAYPRNSRRWTGAKQERGGQPIRPLFRDPDGAQVFPVDGPMGASHTSPAGRIQRHALQRRPPEVAEAMFRSLATPGLAGMALSERTHDQVVEYPIRQVAPHRQHQPSHLARMVTCLGSTRAESFEDQLRYDVWRGPFGACLDFHVFRD
jgi:hypothetical protein